MDTIQHIFVSIMFGFTTFFILVCVLLCARQTIKNIAIKFAFPHKRALERYSAYQYRDETFIYTRGQSHFYIEIINDENRDENTETIVFCHGNGMTAKSLYQDWKHVAMNTSVNVILIEYPGYDERKHTYLTESMIQESAWISFESIMEENKKTKIYLIGHSIGTGVASYLSWRNRALAIPWKIQGLMLISPYESILRTRVDNRLVWWLLSVVDVFPTWQYLDSYIGFLYVVYSETDEVIPSSHAKRFIEKHGALHSKFEGFHSELTPNMTRIHVHRFLEKCRASAHKYESIVIEDHTQKKSIGLNPQSTPLTIEYELLDHENI